MSGLIWVQTVYKGYQQMTCLEVRMQKVKCNGLTISYQNPKGSEVKNKLETDQASMFVFPEIIGTLREVQNL